MGKTKHKKTKDIIDNSKPLEYENLVIEGGGVLGIAYLGALKELYEDQTINKIKCFAGSSIGAIVALILSIRCQYDRLSELILNLNLSEFKDRSWIIPDIARFFNNFGFYKGDKLLSFIQDILKQNADNANITFKEIYDKYETKLVITGTNLSKGNVSYFSYEHTPDMSVALACRISASVPYFFQSVLYNKDYYVDGGILNNYPINVFDHESQQPNMKTLGLKLISEADINMEKGNMAPITNLKNFSQNLINSVQSQSLKIYVKSDDWKRTVPIYTGNLSFLNFNLTNEEKLFLVNEGSKAIKLYKSKMSTLSN
jgi:NTE family protein